MNVGGTREILMLGCGATGLLTALIMVLLSGRSSQGYAPLIHPLESGTFPEGETCLGISNLGIDLQFYGNRKGIDLVADVEFKVHGSFQLQPRQPGIYELYFKHYRSEMMLQVAIGPERDIRELKQELNDILYKRTNKGEATKT